MVFVLVLPLSHIQHLKEYFIDQMYYLKHLTSIPAGVSSACV
jgi:hypothetical protein